MRLFLIFLSLSLSLFSAISQTPFLHSSTIFLLTFFPFGVYCLTTEAQLIGEKKISCAVLFAIECEKIQQKQCDDEQQTKLESKDTLNESLFYSQKLNLRLLFFIIFGHFFLSADFSSSQKRQ